MIYSKHAALRAQQRSVTPAGNLILDTFGGDVFDSDSQYYQFIDDRDLKRQLVSDAKSMIVELKRLVKNLESKDAFAQVLCGDGTVVTAMQNARRHKNHCRSYKRKKGGNLV